MAGSVLTAWAQTAPSRDAVDEWSVQAMTTTPATATHLAPGEPADRRSLLVSSLTGAFGVFSGFAIFFLMIEKAEKPTLFLAVLFIAALLSAAFEWLREKIEQRDGHAHAPMSIARFLVVLIVLVVAEFHVMSWEAFTSIYASDEWKEVIGAFTGIDATESPGSQWDLFCLVLFWVVAGAVLSVALLAKLKVSEGSLQQRMFHGGWIGLRTGALVAPLCLLLFVSGLWLFRGLNLLLFERATWIANLEVVHSMSSKLHTFPLAAMPLIFGGMLQGVRAFGSHPAGPAVVLVVALVVIVALGKNGLVLPAWIAGGCVAFAVLAPLLVNYRAVFELMVRAAIVWAVPGLALGTMSPLLRVSSEQEKPKSWALIAFASAAVLFVITVLRFKNSWWLLAPTSLFVGVGVALRRATRADDYWLPMAAAVAVLVGGLMIGVQSVTSFAGVYDSMHRIVLLPAQLPDASLPSSGPKFAPYTPPDLSAGWYLYATTAERIKIVGRTLGGLTELQTKLPKVESDLARLRERWADLAVELVPPLPEKSAKESAPAPGAHSPALSWTTRLADNQKIRGKLAAAKKETEVYSQSLTAQRAQVAKVAFANFKTLGLGSAPKAINPADEKELGRLTDEASDIRATILEQIDQDLAALRPLREQLETVSLAADKVERDMRGVMIRWLELALTGSLGYWTAISLLVGWSIQRQSKAHPIAA